jgi:hypothetical protein
MKTLLSSYSLLTLALAACGQDPTTGTTTVQGQVVAEHSRQHKPEQISE